MYSGCEIACRLSYKEILYLAASIGSEEIYGLKLGAEHFTSENSELDAEIVKDDLLSKKLLKYKDGKIVLAADIYEIIRTISRPKLFFVAKSKDDLIDISRNYYFAGHIAVKLEYDTINKNAYILTRYDNCDLLKNDLQEFFEIKSKTFKESDQNICLGIDELKDFLQSITDNDSEQNIDILYRKGLDYNYAEDIAKALEGKTCLRTMLIISFDGDTQSLVKEYIIYGGGEYLWQIEFRNTKAHISSISNEVIYYKMSVLADVLYYL